MDGRPVGTGPLEVHLVIPPARSRRPVVPALPRRELPSMLAPRLVSAVPKLVEQITHRIREEVAAFAGQDRHRAHHAVREAVTVAAGGFLAFALGGDMAPRVRAEQHFRGLGRLGGTSAGGIAPVLEAIQVAGDSVWGTIQAMVARNGLPGHVVADLGTNVAAYLRQLTRQVQEGWMEECARLLDGQQRLLEKLITAPSNPALGRLAALAGRRLDEQVVVLTAQRGGTVLPSEPPWPKGTLTRLDGDRLLVVAQPGDAAAVREVLLRLGPGVVVAESWPVPLRQLRDAYTWTCRLLALGAQGRIPRASRVLACAEHRTELLLAADPALIDALAAELLRPLYAEKPHQRLVLAETLLLWLETAEPATALGRRLGTHPQTIRNRIHRLEDMFADRLCEPSQRMTLMVVLSEMVPRWRAQQPPRRRKARTSR